MPNPTNAYPQTISYNGLPLTYSELILDEAMHRGSNISLDHPRCLDLGLYCTYHLEFPSRSLLDYQDLFAKRISPDSTDLKCKAVDKEHARVLLQDERFLFMISQPKEVLAQIDGSGFILTDTSITAVFPERSLPSDSLLNAMCNVSLAAYDCSTAFVKPTAKRQFWSSAWLPYISLVLLVLLALWMVSTRF